MPSYKYPQLNDKKWLYEQYFLKGLSTNNIRDIVGCKTTNSIRQSLIRFDFDPRNCREGLTHNRLDNDFIFNEDVITGCLLGDAGLRCWNKTSSNSYAYFYKKNKYLDHIEYVGSFLFDNPKLHIKQEINRYKDQELIYYQLRSATFEVLKILYNKWYPESNNYKKLIPKDININKTVLLHWYLDDGYSYYRKRKNQKKKQIVSGLCTQSFTKEDQLFLIDKIKYSLGLEYSLHDIRHRGKKSGTGYMLQLPQKQFNKFLDILGEPPVNNLAYKWK